MSLSPRTKSYFLIAPALTVLGVLFFVPFFYFFLVSFWRVKHYKVVRDFSLDNYATTFAEYVELGIYTLLIALIIGGLTTFLGFVYAYIIRFKAGAWGPLLLLVSAITLFGGYLVKIYAWKTILGNEGIINSILAGLHIVKEPVSFLLYSPAAVVVTLVYFLLPLAVLPIYASLRDITDDEVEAARDLGGTRTRVLIDIIVPRGRLGVVAAFVFCFLIAAGDFVTPTLVGGKVQLLGNVISWQYGVYFDWPLGAAMSFSFLAAAIVVIVFVGFLFSLWRPR